MDKEKFRNMYFEFRTRILTKTLGIPRPWRRKEVRNSQLYLKENGIPQPLRCWIDWKKPSTQYSEVSVFCVVEFWKERGCFEHRTPVANDSLIKWAQHQRISCLLEQRVWSEVLMKLQKDVRRQKNEKIMKEVIPQEVKFLVQTPKRETDYENVIRTSKDRRKKSNLPKFTKTRHSRKESPLEVCVDKRLWKSIFEHAESIHTIVLIQIPEFMSQSQDEL